MTKFNVYAAAAAVLFVCASAQAQVTSDSNANSGSNSTAVGVGVGVGGQGGQGGQGGTATSGSISGSKSDSDSISVSVSKGGAGGSASSGANSDQKQGQIQGQQANNANTVAPSQTLNVSNISPDKIKQDINYSGTQTLKSVPSVVVPNLPSVINNDMCVVSAAVGGSGIGFSVGVGFQYKDEDCVRRINARQLFNMGYAKAGIALMAQDASIAKALNDAGYSNLGEPLPPSQPEKLVKAPANPSTSTSETVTTKPQPGRVLNEYEPNKVKYDLQPLVDPSKI